MFKIDQQHLEATSADKDRCNFKLDPGLLLKSSSSRESINNDMKSEDNQIMILRKRHLTAERSSARCAAHIMGAMCSSKSTYLPQKSQQTCETNHQSNSKSSSGGNGQNNCNDKIFSVTTSIILSLTFVTLVGAICLANSNRALLVSAQFSQLTSSSQQQSQQQQAQTQAQQQPQTSVAQQQKQPPAPGGRPQLNHPRQAPASQMQSISSTTPVSTSSTSTTTTSAAPTQSQVIPEQETQASKSQVSIDRFDSGEQIRPPLLRQPTTLAPLTQPMKPQQVSAVSNDNFQTSASQHDTYLSPEDREQLLKSQESHYEGKNMEGNPSQSDPTSLTSSSSSDGSAYERPNRWNQQDGGDHQGPQPLKSSESRSGARPEGLDGAGSEADDGDYEDDAVEPPEQKRANAVPENRRMMGGSGNPRGGSHYSGESGRQRESSNNINKRPKAPAVAADPVNDDSESNDDYSGANDDAYFGRKSNLENGNQLNLAASHNQQNRNLKKKADKAGFEPSGDSENREPDDSPGFGPGPNEAYMVDKAESMGGKAGLDSEADDSGSYANPGESESNMPDGDDNLGENGGVKFDRRSMGGARGGGDSGAGPQSIGHDQSGNPFGGSGGAADQEDDADEGPGEGIDEGAAPAYAQSSKDEMRSPSRSILGLESRLNNVLPKTSASAIASSAALNPNQQQEQVRPVPAALPMASASANMANKQTQTNGQMLASTSPFQQPYPQPQIHPNNHHQQMNHLQQLQQLNQLQPPPPPPNQNQLSILSSLNLHKHTMSAPYNPQNNPSHIGKYFIN